jgi:hypothetical protein
MGMSKEDSENLWKSVETRMLFIGKSCDLEIEAN